MKKYVSFAMNVLFKKFFISLLILSVVGSYVYILSRGPTFSLPTAPSFLSVKKPKRTWVKPSSVQALKNHLNTLPTEAEWIQVSSFPKDFNKIAYFDEKKKLFLAVMLPLINEVNAEILADRRRLEDLSQKIEKGIVISKRDREWLHKLAVVYCAQGRPLKELLLKVDIIPPSLALGQAVVEAGWGVSYAARNMNSPFGIMGSKGPAKYDSLIDGVRNYIWNLNVHNAYHKMRLMRFGLRQQNQDICGIRLAEGLTSYATRPRYIPFVQNIIRQHGFKSYDKFVQSNPKPFASLSS